MRGTQPLPSGMKGPMSRKGGRGVRGVLAGRGFRRLFAVRLTSQFADGLLQSGLATYVLFAPEKQASGAKIAASFAVLLLPYSLVGPFAGVLLDRWRRRQVLVVANLVRAVFVAALTALVAAGADGWVFVACALASLGVNRFYLAALSAGLPHVVHRDQLVVANALATTTGTVTVALGVGLGLTVRVLGGANHAVDAVIVGTAGAAYLIASLLATRLGRDQLGPDPGEHTAELGPDSPGLRSGVRYLYGRRTAWNALAALGAMRVAFGTMTVLVVLLQRATFHRPDDANAGLKGVAITFVAVALGVPLGAMVTPSGVLRYGAGRWIPGLELITGSVLLGAVLPFRQPLLILAAFVLGFAAQGVKVCVDSTVQATVDDQHRGFAFALYDVLFNVAFVAAVVVAALVIPPSGKSPAIVVATSALLTATALWYARVTPSEPR